MQVSLNTTRTIALVAAALGLFCACGLGPPAYHPPPPDLVTVSVETLHFEAGIGHASEPFTFSIANATSQNITINPQSAWLAKNGPFAFRTDCGSSLAANSSCTITVTFRPTTVDSASVPLRLRFGANETHIVRLEGRTDH